MASISQRDPTFASDDTSDRIRFDQEWDAFMNQLPSEDEDAEEGTLHSQAFTLEDLEFDSAEEARNAILDEAENSEAMLDPTKPREAGDKRFWVSRLMGAVYDMSAPRDNSRLVREWAETLKTKRRMIEVKAWEVLERTIVYHESPCFLRPKACYPKNLEKRHGFATHMDELCELLKHEKSICRRLLQHTYMDVMIDNPPYAEKRCRDNRKVNGGKAKMISVGRRAMQAARERDEHELYQPAEDVEERADAAAEQRPAKRHKS